MRVRRALFIACALCLVVAHSASARVGGQTATTTSSETAAATAIAPTPAFTPADLSQFPAENWITNGGNITNARYSSLNQINVSNVANLKEAWHTHLDGSGVAAKYSAEGTPVVYNGIMFIPTGNDDVFALDAATGAHLWTYHSGIEQTINTACC